MTLCYYISIRANVQQGKMTAESTFVLLSSKPASADLADLQVQDSLAEHLTELALAISTGFATVAPIQLHYETPALFRRIPEHRLHCAR
jgi:hypothetical protein